MLTTARSLSRRVLAFAAFVACATTAAIAPVVASRPGAGECAPDARCLSLAPQTARPDFDGDGRFDETRIVAGSRIRVQLSSAPAIVTLRASGRVVSLATVDIDRDGDVDLVAFLDHGGSVVWLNDGHGTFAVAPRRPAPASAGLTGRTWVVSLLLSPLGLGGSHPVWLARPPSYGAPRRSVDVAPFDQSAPRRPSTLLRPGRAPPVLAL